MARAAAPLVPLSLFRAASFAAGVGVVTATGFTMYGLLFYLTLYLQRVHGDSPVAAGLTGHQARAVTMASQQAMTSGIRAALVVIAAVTAAASLAATREQTGATESKTRSHRWVRQAWVPRFVNQAQPDIFAAVAMGQGATGLVMTRHRAAAHRLRWLPSRPGFVRDAPSR